MKKTMHGITGITVALTVICVCAYGFWGAPLWKTLAITAATTCYHFAMRLAVGAFFCCPCCERLFCCHAKWFQVGRREKQFYRRINIKAWKKHIPTYNMDAFSVKLHTPSQIVRNMCQAELVHETIMVLSFFPILASLWVGSATVFVCTSAIGAMIDGVFVMAQRYNRPRVMAIYKIK